MASRASWKGYLKISLVSCAVSLFPAIDKSSRISFRTINRQTGNRVKRVFVDRETDEIVEPRHQGKGIELSELLTRPHEKTPAEQPGRRAAPKGSPFAWSPMREQPLSPPASRGHLISPIAPELAISEGSQRNREAIGETVERSAAVMPVRKGLLPIDPSELESIELE